jgi:hypothetical protein
LPIDFDQRAAKAFFNEIKKKREFLPGAPQLTWSLMDEIETEIKKLTPSALQSPPSKSSEEVKNEDESTKAATKPPTGMKGHPDFDPK